jgi:hypothetical protein
MERENNKSYRKISLLSNEQFKEQRLESMRSGGRHCVTGDLLTRVMDEPAKDNDLDSPSALRSEYRADRRPCHPSWGSLTNYLVTIEIILVDRRKGDHSIEAASDTSKLGGYTCGAIPDRGARRSAESLFPLQP